MFDLGGLTYGRLACYFDRVVRLAGRAVTVVALCLAIGLHWVALQSVAWTAMMVQNIKQTSFCEAMKRTLDGAHPCSLCHIVSKGKSSQEKRDIQSPTAKIDIICVARPIRLRPRWAAFEYAVNTSAISDIGYSPPAPPPRAALT